MNKNEKKSDDDFELDRLDRKILRLLAINAKASLAELSRECHVAVGTIHQRIQKLEKRNVIEGHYIKFSPKKLGLGVTSILGIHLKNARDVKIVLDALKHFDEVVEAHYTTGTYALIVKVYAKDIQDFYSFLANKLQAVKEIQSTESFICLDTPIDRSYVPQL